MGDGLDLYPSHLISRRTMKSHLSWSSLSSDGTPVEQIKAVLFLTRHCDVNHPGGWRRLICKELFQESFKSGLGHTLFQALQQQALLSLHFLVLSTDFTMLSLPPCITKLLFEYKAFYCQNSEDGNLHQPERHIFSTQR